MPNESADYGPALIFADILATQREPPFQMSALDLLGGLYIAFGERVLSFFEVPSRFEALVSQECGLLFPVERYREQRDQLRPPQPVAEYIPEANMFFTPSVDPRSVIGKTANARAIIAKLITHGKLGYKRTPEFLLAQLAEDPEVGPKLIAATLKIEELNSAAFSRL